MSKKIRFEVFKRDSFTCQYCGRMAPDVVLNVDHIQPVANGGTNEITNLVTSCFDCNSGKSNRELSDDSIVKKQQRQLAELNDRREQLEMMLEWRNSMNEIKENQIEAFDERLQYLTEHCLNANGKKNISKLLIKFSIINLLEALDCAFEQYAKFDEDGDITQESVNVMFNKIPGIAYNIKNPQPEYLKRLYYIRGIARNRFNWFDNEKAIVLLKQAYENDADIDDLEFIAKTACNWSDWIYQMDEYIGDE